MYIELAMVYGKIASAALSKSEQPISVGLYAYFLMLPAFLLLFLGKKDQ